MAEITVDTLSGEIKVSDKDKSFVIKTDNIFRAKLYNDNFVCVLTDANTPNEKELLYDLNGELIYEFYRRQSRVIFMKHELQTGIRIGVVAYYPLKKQLLVCGSYKEEGKKGSCLFIYGTDRKLVKTLDEHSVYEIDIEDSDIKYAKMFAESYIPEENRYRICGVLCFNDRIELRMQVIGGETVGGDYVTWRMALDMDTYKLKIAGYDPR